MGVDGKSQALPAPTIINLPASALPSEAELDRALQSITIDPGESPHHAFCCVQCDASSIAPVSTLSYPYPILTPIRPPSDRMDPDLKAALFDGDDDEGGFEELQDDFISQVMHYSPPPPIYDIWGIDT